MAFASDSTIAPTRPLLPLDRRAIGRDGWARARDLAARLGGEIRDHVAEGMRQAWAAARALLQAAASASAPSDASALASESLAPASAPLLPLPAPLPSLTAALSRRRATFGAVAVDEPDTAAEARRLHMRRELGAALEWGFAFLDAFDLGPSALDVVDGAIAALDALDAPDEDREPYLAGVAHFTSGRSAQAVDAEDDSEEDEGTALERHGCGFTASGPDDAEDDDPAELDFRSHGPASALRPMAAHV